jgi:hypothetical protein
MEISLDEEDKQNNEQISIDGQGCITADTSKTSEYSSLYPTNLFTEIEARHQIFCEPSRISPQKGKDLLERAHYHLNEKGQNFLRQSMLAVIEDITGKAPQSISVVSTSTAQILFKEEDLPCFRKLLDSKMIHKVETKTDNFQQKDITRVAHLYQRRS